MLSKNATVFANSGSPWPSTKRGRINNESAPVLSVTPGIVAPLGPGPDPPDNGFRHGAAARARSPNSHSPPLNEPIAILESPSLQPPQTLSQAPRVSPFTNFNIFYFLQTKPLNDFIYLLFPRPHAILKLEMVTSSD